LPLASSNISETDSVVRASDGQIIAIGGLMQQASVSSRTNVPGIGDIPLFGALFSRTEQALRKKELVILIKPTVVHGPKSWSNDVAASRERIERLFPAPAPTHN
jgi:MSHA biogenesis protein MshL